VVVSFDNIRQDLLIRAVKKHAKEQWIVLYIGRWLKAAVQEEDGQVVPREKGTPRWVNYCGGAFEPVLHVCQRLGRKEDSATPDAIPETSRIRLAKVE